MPVGLERESNVRFTVYDDPAPPVFEANFGVELPFRFVVDLTYTPCPANDERVNELPVTFRTQRTPWGAMMPGAGGLNEAGQLVCCADAETGEEPDWPACFGCFLDGGDPWGRFPGDGDFVEVAPGGTWRFEYTLDPDNSRTCGGLDALEKGRRYNVGLSSKAKYGFGRWMFGKKGDLLKGTVEERGERWNPEPRARGPIRVEEMNEPLFFDVVD